MEEGTEEGTEEETTDVLCWEHHVTNTPGTADLDRAAIAPSSIT
jgi:hypothetical protein